MPNPLIDILIPSNLTDLQMQALHVWLATISSTLERRRPFARRNQRHHDHMRDQRELLLLRLQLWSEETLHNETLKQEIDCLSQIIREKVHLYWHAGVTDGSQLESQVPLTNGVRPFSVDLQAFEPENWEEDGTSTLEMQQLLEKVGAVPKYRIQLLGFQESPDDYLLCGYMAAELAQEYEGFAKVLLRPNFYTARGAAEWGQDDTYRLAQSLEGRFYEIQYETPRSSHLESYHLLDGHAMREWTRHARFHLHF